MVYTYGPNSETKLEAKSAKSAKSEYESLNLNLKNDPPLHPYESLNLPELKNALYVARKAIIVDLTKNMSIPPFVIRRCGFFKRLKGEKIAKKYIMYVKRNMSGCSHCAYENSCSSVFDFDHVDESTKIDSISKMVREGRNLGDIENEIKKTQYLCSNCHRERTALQFGWSTFQEYE